MSHFVDSLNVPLCRYLTNLYNLPRLKIQKNIFNSCCDIQYIMFFRGNFPSALSSESHMVLEKCLPLGYYSNFTALLPSVHRQLGWPRKCLLHNFQGISDICEDIPALELLLMPNLYEMIKIWTCKRRSLSRHIGVFTLTFSLEEREGVGRQLWGSYGTSILL